MYIIFRYKRERLFFRGSIAYTCRELKKKKMIPYKI